MISRTLALLFLALLLNTAAAPRSSLLVPEAGTIDVEDLLPQPLRLTLAAEVAVYATSTFERPLGLMPAGTVVTLVGLSDKSYRVRGRARHGDVAGWVQVNAFVMKDPDLPNKLKGLYERQQQVAALIAAHEVALGMTPAEVQEAMGRPTRRATRITAQGRQEVLEYAVFEKVPQVRTGIDPFGNPVQSVVYLKVEVGTLSISFKDGLVDAIDEVKGNPLQGGRIKIVPGPILLR
jgi:hypothetical protein